LVGSGQTRQNDEPEELPTKSQGRKKSDKLQFNF
jgi:hypothetical protein